MSGVNHTIEMDLPATSRAPSMARDALWRLLSDATKRSRASDAELLLSELVTNCVRHAGLSAAGPISLTLEIDNGQLRVEVSDQGRGFSRDLSARADGSGTSGWGLALVEQLADNWGADRGDVSGVRAWFEIQL